MLKIDIYCSALSYSSLSKNYTMKFMQFKNYVKYNNMISNIRRHDDNCMNLSDKYIILLIVFLNYLELNKN